MAVTSDIRQQVFDLLSRASNLSFVSAEREPGGGIGFTPGQRVTAEVLMALPDRRVQVQIGTERFNLNLPMAVRTGQTLEMTFVSAEPRSTFAIARQGGMAPPVSLSDASRLLGLLVSSEQISDSKLRASLQGVGEMLRRTPGEAGVLANLMDEALTYGSTQEGNRSLPGMPGEKMLQPADGQGAPLRQQGQGLLTPEQARLSAFESNAAQILQHFARSSRAILVEALNPPLVPLPLMPGEEVDAAVLGTLPGGRVFVRVAGVELELVVPRAFQEGEILRLTVISSQPRPTFALSRTAPELAQGDLSEAGRWLSLLEHGEGGSTGQQGYLLERLDSILKSLPADSPAFTAILDEAITYETLLAAGRHASEKNAVAVAAQRPALQQGNGIVLSDDMARLLQGLIKGDRLALLEALGQQSQGAGFAPGQQLKGEVLAVLGGGRFMVRVAEQMLEFTMPKGTKPGERINLFFITDEPRATFLMARFGQPGDSRVSETGRWLSGFLGTSGERMPVLESLGILAALLSGPPDDAQRVGTKLQQGLRESGLFYESHLARWFGGEYPLEDLLREPQGRLSTLKQLLVVPPSVAMQAEEPSMAGMKPASLVVMEAAFKKAGNGSVYGGDVDQHSLPLVREQLQSLQSGQIVFRGELFAGQPLEWSVNEREARRNSGGGRERSWDTTLKIDLPRLGSVSARLRLDGDRVAIDLAAGEAAAVGLLDSGREALVEQLQAAGLTPGEIGIRHDAV